MPPFRLAKGIKVRTMGGEMPYIESVVKAGKTIEIQRYYSPRVHPKGCRREKRKKKTKESQHKVNIRKAIDKLRWTLNANFQGGDMHIRLSYAGIKPSLEEMKEHKRQFLRRMRREYRNRGKEFKFIHVFEIGKRGARHHHLVINSIESAIIRKCWEHGSVYTSILDDSGQYGDLASYLIKEITEKRVEMQRRYSPSRNLVIPEPKKRIIMERKYFREKPKAKEGFYVDKTSIFSGFTDAGYQFLKYIQVKIGGKIP
ncbi:MAG: hypothetical protein ACLTPL_14355 [Anaerostipes caccae]|uniref:rolling circle replication-associated protein n=1 Tax=Anaerostipes caccae TaxID=105841 RepID=UPI003995C6C3